VLLVGCSKIPSVRSCGQGLRVDDEWWSVICVKFQNVRDDSISTSLLLYPMASFRSDNYVVETACTWKFKNKMIDIDEKIVCKADSLHFIQEGKTIEISFQELDIDISRLNDDEEVILYVHSLKPILEALIREHVKP
jgi:hypothetical protein